jgi:ferredoxin
VEVCPFGLIVQAAPDLPPSKCIPCGVCAKGCPMEILEVAES